MNQRPQQPPPHAAPQAPTPPPYDRGDFDDGEWGIVQPTALTPQEQLAVKAATSGANQASYPARGNGGR